jgi:hypothetical protein
MNELFRNEYLIVTREQNGAFVRMRRTKEPITLNAIALLQNAFQQLFTPEEFSALRLLVDSRDAPLLRDPIVEKHMGALMANLNHSTYRRAILIKTAVGRLQSTRISRELGTNNPAFDDEAEAIQYLLQDDEETH